MNYMYEIAYKSIIIVTTIIIGLENGTGKGSCRSIPQLDMVDTLNLCSDLLDGHGGHPMAAGLTIKESKLDEFIERFMGTSQRME